MKNLIDSFSKQKILVVGDSMLDVFDVGKVLTNPESETAPRIMINESISIPGGAGNAAANINSLGGRSVLYTCVGSDDAGRTLMDLFRTNNLSVIPYFSGKTIVKRRISSLDNPYSIRFDNDYLNGIVSIDERAGHVILGAKNERDITGLLLSDYDKGIFWKTNVAPQLIKLAKERGIPSIACPKPNNFPYFRGADIVCVNMRESVGITGNSFSKRFNKSELFAAAEAVRDRSDSYCCFVTCGEKGSVFSVNGKTGYIAPHSKVSNPNVVGAGDSFVAALSLALSSSWSRKKEHDCFLSAGSLANAVACLAVKKPRTATVSIEDLRKLKI